jgi:hypothetical protein
MLFLFAPAAITHIRGFFFLTFCVHNPRLPSRYFAPVRSQPILQISRVKAKTTVNSQKRNFTSARKQNYAVG